MGGGGGLYPEGLIKGWWCLLVNGPVTGERWVNFSEGGS